MELPVVLVAEDDDEVVAIIEDALSDAGFDVATVAAAGLALITRRVDQYKALLSDINLQGQMTGLELAKRAREVVPTLPVVYMTGNAAHEWPSQGVPESILLQKPFAPAQAVTAIATLLNRSSLPPPDEQHS
jgi:DNA-binding response OmpR family regulator